MFRGFRSLVTGVSVTSLLVAGQLSSALPAFSQTQAGATAPSLATTTEPSDANSALLSDDNLSILVARVALYPDQLVAAISAASLFPLQMVEASRFLDARKKNGDLKPNAKWDGSVISLLNYPGIVKMMSDDLAWTQSFGNALTNQQNDVLLAIQQLRDEALEKGIIKTDEKLTIVTENDNVVIRPTDPEKIYVPQYPPEMLYQPNYAPAPISYVSDSYPSYYSPAAPFFAAAVTGVIWAAAVNWNNGGVWGGNWRGNVDIDCNDCFNGRSFKGKINLNDVDWKNVDRSKLNISKDQLGNLDRVGIQQGLQSDRSNELRNRASQAGAERGTGLPNQSNRANDVRKSTMEGLQSKGQASGKAIDRGPKGNRSPTKPTTRPSDRSKSNTKRPANGRASGQTKFAGKADNRGGRTSALGDVSSGRREMSASNRGGQSLSGVHRGGNRSAHQNVRPRPQGGRSGRGGGRGRR